MNELTTAKHLDLMVPEIFEQVQRVAKLFCESSLVPDHYKKNVPNAVIAIQTAKSLQVDPMAFMQNTFVIHGKLGMDAKFVISMVNQRGPFHGNIQYKYNGDKSSCFAYAKHKDTGEIVEGPTVSLEMAAAEGWSTKKGSKWLTMPELMLAYRAATFFGRLYCPEALNGLQTTDELRDIGKQKAEDKKADLNDAFPIKDITPEPEPKKELPPDPNLPRGELRKDVGAAFNKLFPEQALNPNANQILVDMIHSAKGGYYNFEDYRDRINNEPETMEEAEYLSELATKIGTINANL